MKYVWLCYICNEKPYMGRKKSSLCFILSSDYIIGDNCKGGHYFTADTIYCYTSINPYPVHYPMYRKMRAQFFMTLWPAYKVVAYIIFPVHTSILSFCTLQVKSLFIWIWIFSFNIEAVYSIYTITAVYRLIHILFTRP